jgi:uncharacterized protein
VETFLRRLTEIDSVTGALFVSKDGMVVASTVESEEEELLGAMIAAAFDAAGRYIEQLGKGSVRYALFETPGGIVQAADGGEMLVAARSSSQASIGRVRLEVLQIARRLAQDIGAR